jgi:hypothetical protein
MFNTMVRLGRIWRTAFAAATLLALTGCSGFVSRTSAMPELNGVVYGGQQPVGGSSVYLYAASTTGYGTPSTSLLNTPVKTSANGTFTITGDYSCSSGQQLYIVAIGGNPGGGTNNNSANMAALGDCASLSASTFIDMNEITTVGSVFALAPFMTSYSAVGSSSTNTLGLAHAFASVNKLVNIGSGTSTGSTLPAGAIGPTAEIDTLADILAACINSLGGTAGDGSTCGNLFTLATPSGGAAPTDTIDAALDIARNPSNNASQIFGLAFPNAPFAPRLQAAPTDWTMAIRYTAGGFNQPHSTTIDATGSVWVANRGNGTVTLLAQTGIPRTSALSGNGLNAPYAIAIDNAGDAWVANQAGSKISIFTGAGQVFSGSPFAVDPTANQASAIAIDAVGNAWATGANGVAEDGATGLPIQTVSNGIVSPLALAFKP